MNYCASVNLKIERCKNVDQANQMADFIMKRLPYHAETKYALALLMVKIDQLDQAEQLLLETLQIYEKYLSSSLEGKVDPSMEDYFLAYFFTAYVYASKGKYVEAM